METSNSSVISSSANISVINPGTAPSCDVGYAWNLYENECQPILKFEPRSRIICPWGYVLHKVHNKCTRVKYHGKQEPGTIKKWWDRNVKKSTTGQPPAPPPTPSTSRTTSKDETDGWFGYGMNYGAGHQRG